MYIYISHVVPLPQLNLSPIYDGYRVSFQSKNKNILMSHEGAAALTVTPNCCF